MDNVNVPQEIDQNPVTGHNYLGFFERQGGKYPALEALTNDRVRCSRVSPPHRELGILYNDNLKAPAPLGLDASE